MSSPETSPSSDDITELLREASGGRREPLDRVLALVYDELHRLARHKLRSERSGHTLNNTALVHEAYLKLVDQSRVEWRSRQQFFAVASEAMRRILIDYAKAKYAAKRGGHEDHVPIDDAWAVPSDAQGFSPDQATELLTLDAALDRLAEFNPVGAQVVQYRFFGGLSNEEVAEVLGTSERSVRRSWTVAKAWLRRELGDTLERTASTLGQPISDSTT
jgi:RNA polymerase sigma-70 factor, ECF subfamily